MSDFIYNVELDESLFSVEPPGGYSVKTLTPPPLPTEKDLIEFLRVYPDATNGQFPPFLSKKINLSEYEIEKTIGLKISAGWSFVVNILPDDSDWRYAGKGAKVGSPDTPIFWYKPEGSDFYRVIYADLAIKNVTPDDLPIVPDAQTRDSQERILTTEKNPGKIKK